MDAKLKEFLIKVSQDEELKKELLETLGDEATEAASALKKVAATVAEFARDKGCEIDEGTVIMNTLKVDDEDIDKVAGGRMYYDYEAGMVDSDCKCFLGGGGSANEYQKTCVCVIGGGGEKTPAGVEFANAHGVPTFLPLCCPALGLAGTI